MLNLRIFIADDEPAAVRRLESLLRGFEAVTVVATATSADEMLERVDLHPADLILLDIEMPGASGISLAARLRSMPSAPAVIFVTAFSRFALDAFNVAATDYLLKPVERERLLEAIDRVRAEQVRRSSSERMVELEQLVGRFREDERARADAGSDSLWFSSNAGRERVLLADILSIRSERDYVHVRTPHKTYFARARLGALAGKLDVHGMIRVHRSAMVRATAVRRIERCGDGTHRLILDDGSSVMASRRFGAAVRSIAPTAEFD